jgi:hypothetical protein
MEPIESKASILLSTEDHKIPSTSSSTSPMVDVKTPTTPTTPTTTTTTIGQLEDILSSCGMSASQIRGFRLMLARLVSPQVNNQYGIDGIQRELRIVGPGSNFIDRLIRFTAVMNKFKVEPLNSTIFHRELSKAESISSVIYHYDGNPPCELLDVGIWGSIVGKDLFGTIGGMVKWKHNGYAVSETDSIMNSNTRNYSEQVGRRVVSFHVNLPPRVRVLLSSVVKATNDFMIDQVFERLTFDIIDFVEKGRVDYKLFTSLTTIVGNYDPLRPMIDNTWTWPSSESSSPTL